MDLVADQRLKLAPLHSATAGLEGMVGAFEKLLSGDGSAVKILIDPNA